MKHNSLPEVLFISSYPPRECGIATFSKDLIDALSIKYGRSYSIKVCALEPENERYDYEREVVYSLCTTHPEEYLSLASNINFNSAIQLVIFQHEFGFYYQYEDDFERLVKAINKPKILVFHTVLPAPNDLLKTRVQKMASLSDSIVVMTNHSSQLLITEYGISNQMITVIPHGTHLVFHENKTLLKEKYGFSGRKVLSTFGLLSAGKSIETTLDALPAIIERNPEVLFLVLGITHPEVVRNDGEKYRDFLEAKVLALNLEKHVLFINRYLQKEELLNYLQLSDIYLFTSKNPDQAVSGTFAYAMSCACPIISTPIPHAREILTQETGIIIDFESSPQLGESVNFLLENDVLREKMSLNVLQRIVSTVWENVVIAQGMLIEKLVKNEISLKWNLPIINLNHIKRLTTDFGIIQFAKIDQPDLDSGYTIDDNARALIAFVQHYELTKNENDLAYLRTYLDFIEFCQQPEGNFLNYVDISKNFTEQNHETNLEDSNGRAIWALGYLISMDTIPSSLREQAQNIVFRSLNAIKSISSPRAMSFVIKGLGYKNQREKSIESTLIIQEFADRLVHLYNKESDESWDWFESYLTYANSILPEALLCAYQEIENPLYLKIAKDSFEFLLSKTFTEKGIKVISNKGWLMKGESASLHGEQPIDVSYTILALSRFYDAFKDKDYLDKMWIAFDWFLGKNHLHQIVYNPLTGGCYDGLEKDNVNLNQGAESTVSYLIARLIIEATLISEDLHDEMNIHSK